MDSHKLQIPGLSYNLWGFQAWDTLQDSTDKTAAMTWLKPVWIDKNISLSYKIQMKALPCHSHLPECLWIMDPHSRAPKKIQAMKMRCYRKILHISYKVHNYYQRGSPCQDPAGNWTTRRTPDDRKEAQTAVVWSCFPFIRSGQNHLERHSERGKKTTQTEEEAGRQHQGMDRPGVRQVSEGSGEQGKMEKTGCKSISGAPTTPAVKGLMMMMMMITPNMHRRLSSETLSQMAFPWKSNPNFRGKKSKSDNTVS